MCIRDSHIIMFDSFSASLKAAKDAATEKAAALEEAAAGHRNKLATLGANLEAVMAATPGQLVSEVAQESSVVSQLGKAFNAAEVNVSSQDPLGIMGDDLGMLGGGGSSHTPAATAEAEAKAHTELCLLYTSPSPRDRTRSRMPSSA